MVRLSIPVYEDINAMTFQVGMVSANGVLLASDCKLTNLLGYRHGRLTPKIEVYESENFAHCSAGDAFCDTFTNVVREELAKGTTNFATDPFSEVKRALVSCVNIARTKEADFRQKRSEISGRQSQACVGGNTLLVFRNGSTVALWTVETLAQYPNPMQVGVGDRAVAGDTNSPAVFFLERYFHQVPNTMKSLIPLVAHTVLMAKGDFVEGLQVGIFTSDNFRTLTNEELKPYFALSEELDSGILKRLTK